MLIGYVSFGTFSDIQLLSIWEMMFICSWMDLVLSVWVKYLCNNSRKVSSIVPQSTVACSCSFVLYSTREILLHKDGTSRGVLLSQSHELESETPSRNIHTRQSIIVNSLSCKLFIFLNETPKLISVCFGTVYQIHLYL